MIENRILEIDRLIPHPRNFRQHPDTQLSQLGASHERFGQFRSVVVVERDIGYTIVAGHGIVEAMKRNGVQQVRADVLPRDTSDEDVEAILVADNLLPQGANDDNAILAELLQEQMDAGFDLEALGSDEETLRQMVEALGDEYVGTGVTGDGEDEAILEDVPTRSQVGDIWQLGERHVIGCLDATNAEQVRQLLDGKVPNCVIADPPYGVNVVKNNMVGADFGVAQKGKYASIIGDETTATAIAAYRLCADFWPRAVQVWWGANNYSNALPPSNCWLVWDKRSDSGIENTFADCELAWTNMTGPSRVHHQLWNGMIREGEHEKRVHPTQKPLALAQWCFEKYGNEQDVIFDPFLGSGITVIAAERMNGNRKVYGCELSPEYIDVIIARWERLTGQTATLVERIEMDSLEPQKEAMK